MEYREVKWLGNCMRWSRKTTRTRYSNKNFPAEVAELCCLNTSKIWRKQHRSIWQKKKNRKENSSSKKQKGSRKKSKIRGQALLTDWFLEREAGCKSWSPIFPPLALAMPSLSFELVAVSEDRKTSICTVFSMVKWCKCIIYNRGD